ncbi:MAG: uracil-DNA glycosylase [Trueperaceae bacterium]|nr:uracil-DNA glycosylase [Trueperaceae bacterium]
MANCRRCPRLAEHREEVARIKRRAYRDQEYWGAPVPGFGDPEARIVLVGLAPGAHGSNRTGRMFTGDGSGRFLYAALHRAGLAGQSEATSRDDGMTLRGIWITATGRCVPPANKPTPEELANCRPWLIRDLDAMTETRVYLALGRIAHDALLRLYRDRGAVLKASAYPFGHGVIHSFDDVPGAGSARALPIVDAFHVSLQNTNTGRLTPQMFDEALAAVKRLAGLD